MDNTPKIEDFFGVYLLCSQSKEKKYFNKVYIGFTVDPNRRIRQHNKGRDFGGAKKTNNKGPWQMILIIHGFPTNISALQFEWAWQWPKKSVRLKHLTCLQKKMHKESDFNYHFRVLSEMLRTNPWNRLPLIIRWLAPDYFTEFPIDKIPPMHMQICHGYIQIKKKLKSIEMDKASSHFKKLYSLKCHLCMNIIKNPPRSKVNCLNSNCELTCHITCLANLCLQPGEYVPIEVTCPICEMNFLWGDLIRKKKGCNDFEEIEKDNLLLSDIEQ